MKKRINFQNHIAVLISAAVLLSSCLKNKGPVQDYSQSPALVGFQFHGDKPIPLSLSVLPVSTPTVANIEVALSVASLTLNSAVSVTVEADNSPINSYNSANPDDERTALDAGDYTIPDGGKVTISPGQQIVAIPINIAGDKVNFSKARALGLILKDANGAIIATNLSSLVLLINLQSPYEGNYSTSGVRTRYNGADEGSGVLDMFTISGIYNFSTVNSNTINGPLADAAGTGSNMNLQVNADNSVTVTNPPGGLYPDLQNNPTAGPSKYDPATKTFTLHCKYHNSVGNLRTVEEVLVMQ